jgi:hypothetical protein
MSHLLDRLHAAVAAFRDNAHHTWVVVEDFHPIGYRVAYQHQQYETCVEWLETNRTGTMRIVTLFEYRRRVAALMALDETWLWLAKKTSVAWRERNEADLAEYYRRVEVAKRDPFKSTIAERKIDEATDRI